MLLILNKPPKRHAAGTTELSIEASDAYHIYSDTLASWDDTKTSAGGVTGEQTVGEELDGVAYVGIDNYYDPDLFDRYRAYLKFNTSVIPAGATITRARLLLSVNNSSSLEMVIDVIEQNWSAQDPITDGTNKNAAYDNCFNGTIAGTVDVPSQPLSDPCYLYSTDLSTGYVNLNGNTYYSLIYHVDKANGVPDGQYVAFDAVQTDPEYPNLTARLVIEYTT